MYLLLSLHRNRMENGGNTYEKMEKRLDRIPVYLPGGADASGTGTGSV